MADNHSTWPAPSESRRVRICLYLSEGLLLGGAVAAVFLFPVLRVIHFVIAGFPRISKTMIVGHTVDRLGDGVAEQTHVHGDWVSYWVLAAGFAEPGEYDPKPESRSEHFARLAEQDQQAGGAPQSENDGEVVVEYGAAAAEQGGDES